MRIFDTTCLILLVTLAQHAFAWISPSTSLNQRAHSKSTAIRRVSNAIDSAIEDTATVDNEENLDYNWKQQWYALTYASYVPNPSRSAEVTPAAVFGEPLVLWREEDDGEIFCAVDRCPHRSAALSEGRLRNGTLYCLYHG